MDLTVMVTLRQVEGVLDFSCSRYKCYSEGRFIKYCDLFQFNIDEMTLHCGADNDFQTDSPVLKNQMLIESYCYYTYIMFRI